MEEISEEASSLAETLKPSIIIVKNQIGFGCPAKQGKASAHGEPLGAENVKAMKENLGWKTEPAFYVPDEAYKESVMPNKVRARVAVEALTSFGWHKYVGLDGKVISLDTFGA